MEYNLGTYTETSTNFSREETIYLLKSIYKKYHEELLIHFLSHIAIQINFENTRENLEKVQNEILGISFAEQAIIHSRAVLALYQCLFDFQDFNLNKNKVEIEKSDIKDLFLLANHFLSKSEYRANSSSKENIPIEILQSSMRMSLDFTTTNEVVLSNSLYILLYERILSSPEKDFYNTTLFTATGLDLSDFINALYKFKRREKIQESFSFFEHFCVLPFDQIKDAWSKRTPQIKIPLEYRFLEQYPMIKKDATSFLVNMLLLFFTTARTPYHTLSKIVGTKFRDFFSKQISEPVVIEILTRIFQTNDIKIFRTSFQDVTGKGMEYADVGIVHDKYIILVEIKSVYMGLEKRYTDDPKLFKSEFDKRYIYNEKGKFQLLNQLETIKNNFEQFITDTGLPERYDYVIFNLLLVFDEALSGPGFKEYITSEYNKVIKDKLNEYIYFLPFMYSNVLTFCDLLSIEQRIKDKQKRFHYLKASFAVDYPLHYFLNNIKSGRIEMKGFSPADIDNKT